MRNAIDKDTEDLRSKFFQLRSEMDEKATKSELKERVSNFVSYKNLQDLHTIVVPPVQKMQTILKEYTKEYE